MASFAKRSGGWRAQLFVNGKRTSATFSTKAEAQTWAAKQETEMRTAAVGGIVAGKTLGDAFDRYEKEVSAHKRGSRWEAIRMAAMRRFEIEGKAFGDFKLSQVTPDLIGGLRDIRLKTVTGSTVNREFNLLSNVLHVAQREWRWIETVPTKDVRRPKSSASRDRRVSEDEIDRMCLALGFDETPATTKSQRVAIAWLFAIETGMRAGEICGIKPQHIQRGVRVVHLPMTKNGTKRDVPLSTRAVELLDLLPPLATGETKVFGLTPPTLDALFRKARENAVVEDLHFHDSRHEAITRLAKKMDVLDLARAVGIRDLKILMVYYNATAADIAKRLD